MAKANERELAYARKRRAVCIDKGLCVACGFREADKDRRLCGHCATVRARRRKARHDMFLEQGMCTMCGKSESLPSKRLCGKCAEYHRYYQRQYKKAGAGK